jgi:hypothetical protein
MFKHVGLHNAQKVTIVLHQMPTEDHMCLVMYDQKLPPRYYDAVKKVLATQEAQETKDFATALESARLDDDRNLAKVLYTEGHLKKVPCNQVFATPFGYESSNKIKLNELNQYTSKIEEGGDALRKLEEFDANKGYKGKHRKENLGEGTPVSIAPTPTPVQTSAPVRQPAPTEQQSYWDAKASHAPIDPASASAELRNQGDILRTAAVQLLQQAKILAEKAETLFPTAPKRRRGRPKGSGINAIAKARGK